MDAPALLEAAIEQLTEHSIHYSVNSAVVNAAAHAVPQNRLRYIMTGLNKEYGQEETARALLSIPSFASEVPLQIALMGLDEPGEFVPGARNGIRVEHSVKAYTMLDERMPQSHVRYLRWIRQPRKGECSEPEETDAHITRRPRPDDLALIRKFAPGQRWMDYRLQRSRTLGDLRSLIEKLREHVKNVPSPSLPDETILDELLDRVDTNLFLRLLLEDVELPLDFAEENHLLSGSYLSRGTNRNGDWFHRLTSSRPSKTIVAHIGKDTYGYIHPYENRALSMREAARIQSFPDHFRFGTAGVVDGYTMIGNAVPPLLAVHFAECFSEVHKAYAVFADKPNRRSPQKCYIGPKEVEQLTFSED